jgi:hypothetical protein
MVLKGYAKPPKAVRLARMEAEADSASCIAKTYDRANHQSYVRLPVPVSSKLHAAKRP